MKRRLVFLAFFGALLLGCSQTQTSTTPKTTSPDVKPQADPAKPETPAPAKLADLPAELRHEAFEWYGFGNEQGVKMKLTQGKTIQKGDQRFELEKIEGNTAHFRQVWGGDLSFYGEARYILNAEGISGTEAQGTKVDPPQLELPAKLTPGHSWKAPGKLEMQGGSISNLSATIVGLKPLKVAGRSIQAMLVRRTSTINVTGKAQQMEVSEYYEKGVGVVKMEVTMKGGGQPTKSFTMEAIQ
jgi:hypothetical protein